MLKFQMSVDTERGWGVGGNSKENAERVRLTWIFQY